jgi:uncharacterized phage protein (TIGR01671 family)
MREIKFRAWDKVYRKMVSDVFFLTNKMFNGDIFWNNKDELNFLDYKNPLYKDESPRMNPFSLKRYACVNLAIMQFTGLLDKNGVDVYEGDIFYAKITSDSLTGSYVKVIYAAPIFDVEDKDGGRCWNPYSIITKGEVIGNVYQNPELMKEKV